MTGSTLPTSASPPKPWRPDLRAITRPHTTQTFEQRHRWIARRAWALPLVGSGLLWASFPPLGWWPLALPAIACWVLLVRIARLDGKRLYRWIWLASLGYWLATFYFVPIPHWALWLGWLALGLYLSVYFPMFVWLSRTLVYRVRVPLPLATATIWVGLELIRGHLFTGLAMVQLGHVVYKVPLLIQFASLAGGYAVSFVIVLVSSLIVQTVAAAGRARWAWLAATILVTAIWSAGGMLDSYHPDYRTFRVALIQGSIDTTFPATREELQKIEQAKFDQYRRLTIRARQAQPQLDLIVWPEGIFPVLDFEPNAAESALPQAQTDAIAQARADFPTAFFAATGNLALRTDPPDFRPLPSTVAMLAGGQTSDWVEGETFNSALMIDLQGQVRHRYYKNHRMIFGEYIPLEKQFPWLREVTPIGRGLTAGREVQPMPVGDILLAPTICFESTVPHLVRYQLGRLKKQGQPADVLINLTNDGWFFGSSALDFHLACNVFRAVEFRRPMLVAANTGFSAVIDANGRMLQQGPRRDTGFLVATVECDSRSGRSLYERIGDLPAWFAALACGFAALLGIAGRLRGRPPDEASN